MSLPEFLEKSYQYWNNCAKIWNYNNKNSITEHSLQHDKHTDYDKYLFRNIDTKDKLALDFGCGTGRNIMRFYKLFNRIDGCDISDEVLTKCRQNLTYNNYENGVYYSTNGVSLSQIESKIYDVVYSTLTFQYIPVYNVRYKLFLEIYRVLKKGGWFTFQMGFGKFKDIGIREHSYKSNYYDHKPHMSDMKVYVSKQHLKNTLTIVGFINIKFIYRDPGPGDEKIYPQWVYVRAQKK
jgi:ubiquinone/menaquinone biosynthesis C-methylase UbiE